MNMKRIVRAFSRLAAVGAFLMAARPVAAETFAVGDQDFLLDGKPYVIRCGEMHFSRIAPEYWRHRLQMAKAMGLNTVCAYLFWNVHEPEEGKFNFSGAADAARFCKLAQEEGLHVVLRPGPYSCAEWDFGGFPWWLLKTPDIKLRTRDPRFLDAAKAYLTAVGKQLAPMQVTNGGPIIMVQVENEYGFWGNDSEYLGTIKDDLVQAGFNVPFFQCDPVSQLWSGHRDDLLSVVNFGSNPEWAFNELRKVQKTGPLMAGEYYPGWFDAWGGGHATGSTQHVVDELKYMLDHRESFSIYMAHGGTSFGFSAGANSPPFKPQSTSYDYDAPISEAGWDTAKFNAIRELFSKYLQPGETLPPVPARNAVIAVPEFELNQVSSLLEDLPKPVVSEQPLSFEKLDQPYGCVLYRTNLPAGPACRLVITELHDYATVLVDGERVATLDRRRGQSGCTLPAREKAARLDILVDSFGRINFGPGMKDFKGITKQVSLMTEAGETVLSNWEQYKLPLETLSRNRHYKAGRTDDPAFYRGAFKVDQVGDTFLDTTDWGKGMVWINGHNLGRYWKIGPQQTLYVPGPWLKTGSNDVVVFENDGLTKPVLRGLAQPILNQVKAEPGRTHRATGQAIRLDGLTPVYEGTLENNADPQVVKFAAPAKGRYLTIEALSSHANDKFATLAELYAVSTDGKDISRLNWQVAYADSEEMAAENGSADNVFDMQPTTFWHSRWAGNNVPGLPHQIVIDLGAVKELSGLRMLQRPDTPTRIKEFRVFLTEELPPGV